MPPLGVEGLESVVEHGLAQQHAVGKLHGGDAAARRRLAVVAGVFARLGIAAEVGMALGTEPVEGAAHVELFLGLHIEEGEVNGASARVAALGHDVLLVEEYTLVEVGIEVGLHQRVGDVLGPAHEVVNALLRTVGIVDFQAVALLSHVVAHLLQCCCGLLGKQGRGLLVAVDALAHEVVGAEVAYLQYGVGHGIGKGDELAAVVGGTEGSLVVAVGAACEQCYAAAHCQDGKQGEE